MPFNLLLALMRTRLSDDLGRTLCNTPKKKEKKGEEQEADPALVEEATYLRAQEARLEQLDPRLSG